MKKPCIRNLECFRKTGCPQRPWDGENGCPAWKEMSVSTRGNPLQKEIRRQCLDEWMFEFAWAHLGVSETTGNVMDSLRNGLVVKTETGEMMPKITMDLVMNRLVQGSQSLPILIGGK